MTDEIIIEVVENEVAAVIGVPPETRVIVRDWDHGNVPDERGDLYEDTVIQAGVKPDGAVA